MSDVCEKCQYNSAECERVLKELQDLHEEMRIMTNRLVDIRARVKRLESTFHDSESV